MSCLPGAVQRYLNKSAVKGPWALAGETRAYFNGAVVIPALAEGESLFATLQSLAANPPQEVARFLVVVVVNHGEQASSADKMQNEIDTISNCRRSAMMKLNEAIIELPPTTIIEMEN